MTKATTMTNIWRREREREGGEEGKEVDLRSQINQELVEGKGASEQHTHTTPPSLPPSLLT